MSPQGTAARAAAGFTVDGTEAGQKLMSLLEHRFGLPATLLHRWIRTGQIRLNGARIQPFVRVNEGDLVRMPPFADSLASQANAARQRQQALREGKPRLPLRPQPRKIPDVEVIAEDEDYWAVFKPSGLPTQPGTGHADAMTLRCRSLAAPGAFAPSPVHRLDKDTSGLLLVAKSFAALQKAHEALRTRTGLHKEYLVWVQGYWPFAEDRLLRHYLSKRLVGGQERVTASDDPSRGVEALLVARPLTRTESRSLLLIRLLTGRTHQIRVQMAQTGHPVLGDGKYGQASRDVPLCLHAVRLRLADGREYTALPRWPGQLAVTGLPAPLLLPEDDAPAGHQSPSEPLRSAGSAP